MGFLGGVGEWGERHGIDGIAVASVAGDRMVYLGYQMTLVTVWRTLVDAEGQKFPHM